MKLRIIDWNLNGRADVERQLTFMDSLGWDVLLLQEVRRARFDVVRNYAGVGAADFALEHRPDREKKRKDWCNAIVVREGLELIASAPMTNVPSPERALIGLVRDGSTIFEVASLALPPASSGWHGLKGVQADVIGDRWASRTFPLIAGLDRNTPRTDPPELAKVQWNWEAEERLFGTDPKHDMRDVLRTFLDDNPEERRAVVSARPEGPLGTSYIRGKGRGNTPARYDAIYVSAEFDVLKVRYPWEESMEAGSDHGAVWAHLELRNDAPPPQAGKEFQPLGEARREQVRLPNV